MSIQVNVIVGEIQKQEAQAVVVNLFEGVENPGGATAALDQALSGQITSLIKGGDFKGKSNEIAVLYPSGKLPAQRVILVGLGKPEKFTVEAARQASATAAKKARDLGVTHLHSVVHGAGAGGLSPESAAQAVVEGTILGLYRFLELKTKREDIKPDLTSLTLVEFDASRQAALESGATVGQIMAESTCLARDLVNRPANIANPTHIAAVASEMAEDVGLQCRIMEKPELEELGMEAFLSVNWGGGDPARMVILEHNAGVSDLPTVVLVGKGITFDTGGISIKPAKDMWLMKGDMAGAAAVIGALRAAALLELPLHIVGLTPLTENMPDAFAAKPGDVVRSLKGLTIEITNTDAEGRMALADALTYAGEFHPDAIIDIATLTGSHVVALGEHAAGAMGDESLLEQLKVAGEETRERIWPMPMFEEYAEQLKSNVADIVHLGGRPAGCVTAGIFLSKFVPNDVPWVHLDIAGMEIVASPRPYIAKGATGMGVRLFVETLRNWKV